MNILKRLMVASLSLAVPLITSVSVEAQEVFPIDNGMSEYHRAPRWRDTEAHPIRVFAYLMHPVGWVLREGIFRPLSYFASSTEQRRSIMGYREPTDWKSPDCFSPDSSVPDCRTITPFNYSGSQESALNRGSEVSEVYFPNVYFDFARKELNVEGRQQVRDIANTLNNNEVVKVVLEGHTDDVGSNGSNQTLGMNRAYTVKAELEDLGVSSDRLSTVSFGETKPVDPAKTSTARAKNRRVEVKVDSE